MKKFLFLTLLFLPSIVLLSQESSKALPPGEINWMSIEEAEQKMKTEPRKIFIDLYTSWCGWCKKMDATTFQDPSIVDYLNTKYYAVKFDAEQADTIVFNNFTFYNLAQPGQKKTTHLFAYSLLDGKMGYPSYAILDEKLNRVNVFSGYHQPEPMLATLMFFGSDQYLYYNQYLFKQIQQQQQRQQQTLQQQQPASRPQDPAPAQSANPPGN